MTLIPVPKVSPAPIPFESIMTIDSNRTMARQWHATSDESETQFYNIKSSAESERCHPVAYVRALHPGDQVYSDLGWHTTHSREWRFVVEGVNVGIRLQMH